MNRRRISPQISLILLILSLSACAGLQTASTPEAKVDLLETEQLGSAAYDNNNHAESEKYYTILVREIPEESLHWFRLGNIYAWTERPDAAVIAYREAVVRDPGNTKAWYNMGILQLKQAANSFNQLLIYSAEDDPLGERGKLAYERILGLLKTDNNDNAEEDPAE